MSLPKPTNMVRKKLAEELRGLAESDILETSGQISPTQTLNEGEHTMDYDGDYEGDEGFIVTDEFSPDSLKLMAEMGL
jgi:hypothetical protein